MKKKNVLKEEFVSEELISSKREALTIELYLETDQDIEDFLHIIKSSSLRKLVKGGKKLAHAGQLLFVQELLRGGKK